MNKRIFLQHAKRTYHDYSGAVVEETSGFWIIDMDINSPNSVERYVKEVQTAELVERDCVEHLYCGLPYLVPVMTMIWKTHWIPGPMPYLITPLKMTIISRKKTAIGENISFKAEGK